MKKLTTATEKIKRSRLVFRSVIDLSIEWKLLFILLSLMAFRLATIIVIILKQLHY